MSILLYKTSCFLYGIYSIYPCNGCLLHSTHSAFMRCNKVVRYVNVKKSVYAFIEFVEFDHGMRRSILFLLIIYNVNCQESAHYLQNAVRDLRRLNYRQTLRRVDTGMVQNEIKKDPPSLPTADRRINHNSGDVPPLSLTKGELLALYENALAKGDTLKLNAGDDRVINAAVHELNEYPQHNHHAQETKTDDGYYYYYYPLKSFLDEMTSHASGSSYDYHTYKHKPVHVTTKEPPYTYHSHHHEHNISIKKELEEKKHNKLEPLFMAISGFVGMAVMFVLSMIILPKFGSKPKKIFWPKSDDMDELARLALNAIEGNDCRERFACELNKTARNFNMQENRFIKLLRRMAPGTFGKHIERFSTYGNRKLQCTLIPCRKRIIQKVQKPTKKMPVRKKIVVQKN